jgi:hypothetical protein
MRLNRLVITTAAVTLALAPTGATAAAGNATGSSPSVRPNPDEQILTAPGQPAHAGQPATRAVQPNPDEQTPIATNTRQGPIATNTRQGPIASTPAVIVRVSSAKSGFDWGDAGIGAAGGLGLSLIALAGGLAVSQRRARRTGSAVINH